MRDYIVRGLSHIGLRTHELEKCTDFYIRHLGFRMYYKKSVNGLECWFIENGGLILEFVDNGTIPSTVEGPIYHIALEVCGLEALVAQLKAEGVLPEDAQIQKNPTFFPSGIKNIFFYGPAGEKLELFELAQ